VFPIRRHRRGLPALLLAITEILAITGILAIASCRAAPTSAVRTPYGEARAERPDEARQLALLLSDLAPRVRDLLPDCRSRTTDVWLDDLLGGDAPDGRPEVVGLTSLESGRIHLRRDRLGLDADFILAHELVHAHLGPSWKPLPAILKEGLCDVVAARLAPTSAVRVRAVRLVDASFSDPGMALELTYSEPGGAGRTRVPIPISGQDRFDPVPALGLAGGGIQAHEVPGDESALYGYGLLVTDRIVSFIGLEGLHELCLRSTSAGHEVVPTPWILAAAGLDESAESWRAALVHGLAAPELAAQCEFLAGELTGFLIRTFRYRFPGFSAEAFLDRSLPTVGWKGSDARVAVAMVDGVRSGLADNWEASGPRVLSAGDGWWLRDELGVHLTHMLPPGPGEDFLTISRLGLGLVEPVGLEGSLLSEIPADGVRVEAYLKLGRDRRSIWLKSLHPQGFLSFTVELDGVMVADLESDRNVLVREARDGWVTLTARLPGTLDLCSAVLFGREPNLRVTQQAIGDHEALHFSLSLDRDRTRSPVTNPTSRGPGTFTAAR
jgi:hypothetical protein